MPTDREALIQSLGGEAKVAAMSHEQRADALEEFEMAKLDAVTEERRRKEKFPTVAELEASVAERTLRRGAGTIFQPEKGFREDPKPGARVKILPKMPEKPTLFDFFTYRLGPAAHLKQSAALAKRKGCSEEVVLACLLHDLGGFIMKADHGYYGAQLIEPYVSEKVSFAVRYHQALRFYADPAYGYEYPVRYYENFGIDYVPPPHIERAHQYARNHKWYEEARLVTCNDLYAFNKEVIIDLEEFRDIIGRHFRQPEEGLGYDDSPASHMWRTFIKPDAPL